MPIKEIYYLCVNFKQYCGVLIDKTAKGSYINY